MIPTWQMEAYETLRTEVVKSAVRDLQKAMRKSDRLGCVCGEQRKLEQWFLSKWGQMLSGDNGKYIIEKCRKTYKSRVFTNGRQQLPDEVQKRICADYESGMGAKDIQSKYGISSDQMHRIIRRWGR